jgi:tRNA(adenine34) deaminase
VGTDSKADFAIRKNIQNTLMPLTVNTPGGYMLQALKQAQIAFDRGEVPVGAVIVCGDRIVAKAHNQVELLNDPTAHAEMLAITAATDAVGRKYLSECTLYVTLEPCPMCAGALYWAQLAGLCYGAPDAKRGFTTVEKNLLHPTTEVTRGLLSRECGDLMKKFFEELRN